MRRHVIRTTKILAVAMTAAACTGGGSAPPAVTADAIAKDAPPPVVVEATTLAVVERAEVAPPEEAPTRAASTRSQGALTKEQIEEAHWKREMEREEASRNGRHKDDPKLIALRDSLPRASMRYDKLAARPEYRPLCDAAGYPLVGNLMLKSGGGSVTALCRAVRKDMKK